MMLVCRSRPGMRESHGARPLNMSSESFVRKRISPIQTKSGSAVSVHDESDPHSVTAIASPTGRLVKSCIPSQATPMRESPIHRPLPSRTKRSTMRRAVMSASILVPFRLVPRPWLLDELQLVARHLHALVPDEAHGIVDHRDQQNDGAQGPPDRP